MAEPMDVQPAPPTRRRGYDPGEVNFRLFTRAQETAKRQGNPNGWVHAASYESNYALVVRRKVLAGEWDVPGGVDAWEIKAPTRTHHPDPLKPGYKKVTSELWVKRKKKKPGPNNRE